MIGIQQSYYRMLKKHNRSYIITSCLFFDLYFPFVQNINKLQRYIFTPLFFFTRAKFDANNGLFKESLVKYKGKRTSQDVAFIIFSALRDEKIINATSSRRYFFFTRAKLDANNGLFKESLVKYKGKRTSQDVAFIIFSSLSVT